MNGTDLISGLDTDSIIKKLVSGTQTKIDNQVKREQTAEWKRDAYRDIISQLQNFSKTYFSYSNNNTNLLSSSFFDMTSLVSSSSLVKASGSASNAQNMVIQNISSLASKASYSSGQQVSDQTIVSGKLQTEWARSSTSGKTLKLQYEGETYNIRLSGDLTLDSNDLSEDKVGKIVDELNKQVNANDNLKGNVSFSKAEDGKISLKTEDSSKQVTILEYKADSKDTSGKHFLETLGFTSGTSGSSITGSAVDTSTSGYLFNKTIDSDSELQLNVNGQTYTLTLGANYDISDSTSDSIPKNIATMLQKQIDADAKLKGKVEVSGENGKISFKATEAGGTISIADGSRNLLDGLGLTKGGTPSSEVSGTTVDMGALTTSYLPDTLAGNSLTFNLDGMSKTITFDKGDLKTGEDFNSAAGIAKYLTRKLDSAYGTGKVKLEENNGALTFRTDSTNSVLSLSSSDATNVLNQYGALRISSGESNRTELTKTLGQLSGELVQPLTAGADGKYTLEVNGKKFSFSKDDTLSSVISKINGDKDANVTVSYSQTTNTFRVTYDETGSQGKIEIADAENGGNLAGVLFGVNYDGIRSQASQPDTQTLAELYGTGVKGITETKNESGDTVYSISGTDKTFTGTTVLNDALKTLDEARKASTVSGTDLHMKVALNGSSTPLDIVRSSNTTTIDGVDLTVSGTTAKDADGNFINANITFSAENNVDDLYKKISDFVNDYNKIIDTINNKVKESPEKTSDNKQKYTPLTDAQKADMSDSEITKWEDKAKQGILQNDSKLSGVLFDLRSTITSIVESTGTSLSSIGISTVANDYSQTSGGQLVIDEDKLKKAIGENPEGIAELFTSEDGIAQKVNNVLNKNVGTFGGDGILLLVAGSSTRASDDSMLGTEITRYQNTISDLKDELQSEEERYWDKFTAMEQSLSLMMSQSSYLTSMLGNS